MAVLLREGVSSRASSAVAQRLPCWRGRRCGGLAEAWVQAAGAFLQPSVIPAAWQRLSGSLGSVIDLEMCCE